jgi:lipopolysaccharide export system permease protein
MSILDRYCAKEFLRFLAIIVISFVCLYLIIDFFEKIRMFLSNQANTYQMVSFFFCSMPMIIWQILPASILMAALISFGSLSRHSEIIAMKACGVSLYRTAVPIIGIAVLICALSFIISEFITPYTNQKANHIMVVEIQKQVRAGAFRENQIWYRGKEGIYNFKVFDRRTNSLQGITIYYVDNKLHLVKRIDAERGEWRNGKWIFYNVVATSFIPGTFPELQAMPHQVMALPENPDNFLGVQKDAENMGYLELRRYIRDIQSEGYDATSYRVDLNGKLAFPLVNIIMAIIGLASALQGKNRGSQAQGLAAGIVIGFSYWIVFAFTISLGRAGLLPPLLAAWSANILFGLAASLLFLRVRA